MKFQSSSFTDRWEKNGNGSEIGNFWLKLWQFYLFISWINIMDFSSIAYFKACLNFFSSVSTKKNFCLCHEVRVPALCIYSGWWLKNHIIVLNLVMWNWIFDIVFFSKLVLCLIGFEVEICKQHQAIYRFLHFNYFKRIIRLHPIYSCKREILSFLKV